MNGNSSKQVLLSVLGIAVLVVAVVGVSFAFFTYSRTGTANNVISSGEIYTYLQTAAAMTLSDAMPAADPENIVQTSTGDIGAYKFTVVGTNDSDTAISYVAYIVPGDNPSLSGKTNKLADTDIGILVDAPASAGDGNTAVSDKTTAGALSTLTADGIQIAHGTIGAGKSASHEYTVNLWVRSATVTISDTDENAKYCAKALSKAGETFTTQTDSGCETGKTVYSTTYWSSKVKVTAAAPNGYVMP